MQTPLPEPEDPPAQVPAHRAAPRRAFQTRGVGSSERDARSPRRGRDPSAWAARGSVARSTTTSSSRRAGLAPSRVSLPRRRSAARSATRTASTGRSSTGLRVGAAMLADGDVVTIGNVDLVFSGGELVRRTEAATRTGGLEVRDVEFSVSGKALLRKHHDDRRAGHSDRHHRRVRRGQDNAVAPDRRIRHPELRLRSRSRATTSTPSTRRCAPGSAWSPRTTSCTAS